ncbi:hypothetical protein L345_15015 [Ophiophagus hannah]|uniref:Uncharacterized protein n=1 Tax=Ophiophagus hannah TaxID=8665 RepID=V8NAY2_OPHHA|nr:hypothetical protein L345_15015 [Ophiophagus hannah]
MLDHSQWSVKPRWEVPRPFFLWATAVPLSCFQVLAKMEFLIV